MLVVQAVWRLMNRNDDILCAAEALQQTSWWLVICLRRPDSAGGHKPLPPVSHRGVKTCFFTLDSFACACFRLLTFLTLTAQLLRVADDDHASRSPRKKKRRSSRADPSISMTSRFFRWSGSFVFGLASGVVAAPPKTISRFMRAS